MKIMIVKSTLIVILSSYFFYVYARDTDSINFVEISPQMKEKILNSSLKADLRTNEKEVFRAYLYAEDEIKEPMEIYSCLDGEVKKSDSKVGHYYIYLYDIKREYFIPKRIKIFSSFGKVRMNLEGADLIVLSGAKEKRSDVLLISQFGDCNGNFFEGYGFSTNNSALKKYNFLAKKNQEMFYGRIGANKSSNSLFAYGVYDNKTNEIKKMSIRLSEIGENILLNNAQ